MSEDAASVGRDVADAFGGSWAQLRDERQVARVVTRVATDNGSRSCGIDIVTVQDDDIERHLLRRDYTINAMALPVDAVALDDADDAYDRLLDPAGGLRDLREGIVRMASPAALEEDPARLMRGARLAAQFGFALDADTAHAIRARAYLVAGVAQERMRDELMRLLRTPNAREGVRLLDDLGLLCAVMPELAQAKGVTQPKEHYYDVFNHLVEAVGWIDAMFCKAMGDEKMDGETMGGEYADESPDESRVSLVPRFDGMDDYFAEEVSDGYDRLTFLKLAALVHDIAKPATKTIENTGRIRFFGHDDEGAEVARAMLTRLRFGNKGVEHVAHMVQKHLRPRMLAQGGKMPSRRALYRYYRRAGDIALDTLYLNTADYLAARGPMLGREEWARHCDLIRHILVEGRPGEEKQRKDSLQSLPKLVDGYDIIDRFALAPGRAIGNLLEEVREAQASGDVNTREQALELVRTSIERGGNGA